MDEIASPCTLDSLIAALLTATGITRPPVPLWWLASKLGMIVTYRTDFSPQGEGQRVHGVLMDDMLALDATDRPDVQSTMLLYGIAAHQLDLARERIFPLVDVVTSGLYGQAIQDYADRLLVPRAFLCAQLRTDDNLQRLCAQFQASRDVITRRLALIPHRLVPLSGVAS